MRGQTSSDISQQNPHLQILKEMGAPPLNFDREQPGVGHGKIDSLCPCTALYDDIKDVCLLTKRGTDGEIKRTH